VNIPELLQRLDPGAMVKLFEIDVSSITGTSGPTDHFYFHAGTDDTFQPIVWQGKTYSPWAIIADGFEMTAKGTLPRPSLTIGNYQGLLTALSKDLQDLVGASVIRRRTFARYLDGQPDADPNQYLPDDLYYIERKVRSDKNNFVFELASALDIQGVQLPGRAIATNFCSSVYRGPECSYAGTNYFDVNNNVVGTLAQDVCSKSLTGCKLRFGATAILPFGGFPAAKAYRF
jgi:lambda family phage minor tail protein L